MNKIKTYKLKNGEVVAVRFVEPGDGPQLVAYINALSKEDTYLLLSGEQINLAQENIWLKNTIQDLKDKKGFVMIALNDNKEIVSLASIHRWGKRQAHYSSIGISVARAFRKSGLGTTMMSELETRTLKYLPHIKYIQLGVFAENYAARRVYKNTGYKEIGLYPNALLRRGHYSDEIMMVKKLK